MKVFLKVLKILFLTPGFIIYWALLPVRLLIRGLGIVMMQDAVSKGDYAKYRFLNDAAQQDQLNRQTKGNSGQYWGWSIFFWIISGFFFASLFSVGVLTVDMILSDISNRITNAFAD